MIQKISCTRVGVRMFAFVIMLPVQKFALMLAIHVFNNCDHDATHACS